MTGILSNIHFRAACDELGAVGFRLSRQPQAGSEAYWVISGRANQRWWLLPLNTPALTVSSFGLFQPVLPSARLLKAIATSASKFGLAGLWAQRRIHVTGALSIADELGVSRPACAFFTGTASPHRKAVIQVMEGDGRIACFVKVSRNTGVCELLRHETNMLHQIRELDLQTAFVPRAVMSRTLAGTHVLATDTLKTSRTRFPTALLSVHLEFLGEMSERSATEAPGAAGSVLHQMRQRFHRVENRLDAAWRERLEGALEHLARCEELIEPKGLAHGDFTPWNTFPHEGRLFVFDWEYAGWDYPADYDLIHFLQALPVLRKGPLTQRFRRVEASLSSHSARKPTEARALMVAYLCARAVRYAERETERPGSELSWDEHDDMGKMLDHLNSSFSI